MDEAFVCLVDWRRFVDLIPERIMPFLVVLREYDLDGGLAGFAQHRDFGRRRVMEFSGSRRDLFSPHKHAADMQIFLGTNAMGFPKV